MHYLSPARSRRVLSAPVAPPAVDHMRRVIVGGLVLTMTLVVLQAATQAIDFSVFDLRIWAFNCDKRYSVFGLASLFAQLAVAAACLWRGRGAEAHRGVWLGLGALVGVLILIRGLTTFNAKVLVVPLACVFLMLCWLTLRDPGPVRAALWSGLVLLAASLLLHKVGLGADDSTASDFTWAYQITSMIKHGAELAGWMMLATGIVAGSDELRRSLAGALGRLRPGVEAVGG
jgi:hypothetical protein